MEYKLFLVDDEEIVRMGIQKIYHMEDYGFTVAGSYGSPMKALADLEKEQPDLIITDIRMPRMTGLEFAQKAREILPEVEIVILSGYDDFSYAQTAVKIGVRDYLLKPVKRDDFESMLHRMHERIEKKYSRRENYRQLRQKAQRSQNELKNYFFLELVDTVYSGSARMQKMYDELGMDFQDLPFLLIKFNLTKAEFEEDTMTSIGRLTQEVRDDLEAFGYIEDFLSDEDLYFLLYDFPEEMEAVIRQVAEDYEQADEWENLHLTVAVSSKYEGLDAVFDANAECNRQIWSRHLHTGNSVADVQDVISHNNISIPYADMEEFFRSITMGEKAKGSEALDRIYALPEKMQPPLSLDFSYSLTFMLLLRMYQVQSNYENDKKIIPPELLQIANLRKQFTSIEEQRELVEKLADEIMELLKNEETAAPSKIMTNVLDYINKHFTGNITLSDTAEAAAVSKSYLCEIFKKELGMTFINYITNLRIDRAKQLLSGSDMKMYEISSAVGFNDYTYFSQIFKKKTGMTLSQYRKRH